MIDIKDIYYSKISSKRDPENYIQLSYLKICFQGRIFYLTPSIFPSWKKLKTVIEAAGGIVENRRRKDIEEIKALNKPGQDPMYIIVACEHDLHIVADVLMAKIGIYNTEFVMSAIMRSKMDFDLTKSLTTV